MSGGSVSVNMAKFRSLPDEATNRIAVIYDGVCEGDCESCSLARECEAGEFGDGPTVSEASWR
jgi:hypothetical protein